MYQASASVASNLQPPQLLQARRSPRSEPAPSPIDLGATIHMRILQHCFRVYAAADEFEATIRFYEGLQQAKCERRVKIPETRTEAAKVGRFLILGGDQESLRSVKDVDAIFY